MSAELIERAVLVRLTPEQYVEKVAGKQLRRRDRLVLAAVARRAHWQSWRWGEGAYRCVENIAADTGYCERSVRYAFRSLVESGWLAICPRPGRTNDFTVLRPVTPIGLAVDDEPEGVDVGDNRPPETPSTPATGAGGAAKVAADQYPLPGENPPVAPPSAQGPTDGADAPAQRGAPMAPRKARAPSGTPPPSSAGHGAEPHRQDAGGRRGAGRAVPSPDGVLWGVSSLAPPPDEPPGVIPTSEHWTRAAARKLRPCPTCHAVAGAPCRGRGGKLRKANHRERRIPR